MSTPLSLLIAEAANHATSCLHLRGRMLSHEWDCCRAAWNEVENRGLPIVDDYVEEVRLLLEPTMHAPTQDKVRLLARDLNTLCRCADWWEVSQY